MKLITVYTQINIKNMLLHINKEVSNYFKTDHDVLFLIVAPIIIKCDNNNLEKQCVIYSMWTCAYTTNGLSGTCRHSYQYLSFLKLKLNFHFASEGFNTFLQWYKRGRGSSEGDKTRMKGIKHPPCKHYLSIFVRVGQIFLFAVN